MKDQIPHTGDTRNRQGFLFFPRIIARELRWLTYEHWIQEYTVENHSLQWIDVAWGIELKLTSEEWVSTNNHEVGKWVLSYSNAPSPFRFVSYHFMVGILFRILLMIAFLLSLILLILK